jgi:hypothetical protein
MGMPIKSNGRRRFLLTPEACPEPVEGAGVSAPQNLMTKSKTPAYTYHTVTDREPSKSSPGDFYAIKIRVDNRIPDPLTRIRSAVLTCNCSGWIFSKDDPKSCVHTREKYAYALTRFIAQEEQPLRDQMAVENEPWLPEIRDEYGIPVTADIVVRDHREIMRLSWKVGRTTAVVAFDKARQVELVRAALNKAESRFQLFDIAEWMRRHPITPRALPWAPGLERVLSAGLDTADDGNGDFAGWLTAANSARHVEFGRLPKKLPARRARFEQCFAGMSLDERVAVKWIDADGEHDTTGTVAEFAAMVGVANDNALLASRLVRLCGATLVSPHPRGQPRPPSDGNAYDLLGYTIGGKPIAGFTIDTCAHIIWLRTSVSQIETPETPGCRGSQHLIHLDITEENERGELRFFLDPQNEIDPFGIEAKKMFAVAAQFLVRAGMLYREQPPPCSAICRRLARYHLFRLDEFENYLPDEAAADVWPLTAEGRRLLDSVAVLECFASTKRTPLSSTQERAVQALQEAATLVHGEPISLDSRTGHGLRREIRAWLVGLRSTLDTPESAVKFGTGAPEIAPKWL